MYRIVSQLLSPFLVCYLLLAAGVASLWFKRRETRGRLLLVTLPLVAMTVLCTPAVSYFCFGSLEWFYPNQSPNLQGVQAIVVLSGYAILVDKSERLAVLGEDTLARCMHAAEIYRRGARRPVVVAGGDFDTLAPGLTLADLMRDFLVKQGVSADDVLVERRSASTYENARNCQDLLAPRKIRRVVLVTDAIHLLRAERCFQAFGFDVVPSGCRYRTARPDWSILSFLPNASSSRSIERVVHEWAGIFWYRVRYGV
jgi:uncharacterized SAM-binding protein YcdF (DUF218 family)